MSHLEMRHCLINCLGFRHSQSFNHQKDLVTELVPTELARSLNSLKVFLRQQGECMRSSLIISISLSLLMVLGFQNCSGVNFDDQSLSGQKLGDGMDVTDDPVENDNNTTEDPTKEEPGSNSPITNLTEDELIEDIISKNEGCDFLFTENAALDMSGADFTSNGKHTKISLRNAGKVNINGVSAVISIDGAKLVDINGNHDALCLRAKYVKSVNGNSGTSGAPIVIVGEDESSSIGSLNGNRNSDLVIINMKATAVINGNNKDIYISGGEISSINGNGGNLYLSHEAVVERINGNFKNIYAYPGVVIKEMSGKLTVQPL